jgi:hypothetical protein
MPKHILVKLKYWQLIIHWNIIFGIFLAFSACGDLVEESDTGACESAIDARNYDKAISVCTSRKDKASAYMGKAGYDIINMLKSSGSSATAYTEPSLDNGSDVSLGTDDVAGASILNILQRSVAVIADDDARATAIANSKTNLDSASALLQPYLNDNSQPLSTDEILLNTFAISFAMQLHQLESFDKKTTSTTVSPEGGDNATNLTCTGVTNANLAGDKLIAMDGHLWSTEMYGMQCKRIKDAILGFDNITVAVYAYDNLSAWQDNSTRGLLPDLIREEVCEPVVSLTTYFTDLTDNIEKIKSKLSLSGDNTKAITNAQTSTNTLMKAIGCKE